MRVMRFCTAQCVFWHSMHNQNAMPQGVSTRTDAGARATGRNLTRCGTASTNTQLSQSQCGSSTLCRAEKSLSWNNLDEYHVKRLNSHLAWLSALQFTSLVGSEPEITSMLLEVDVMWCVSWSERVEAFREHCAPK